MKFLRVFMAAILMLARPALAEVREDRETITCQVDWVHDGDTFRCHGYKRSSRLYAIDAPEIGKCRGRQGRVCVPGDGEESKEYLIELIGGRDLQCQVFGLDGYQRPIMRCSAGGVDLSCAMVKAGHAIERYRRLGCGE